jgi:hypothetical protein
MEGKSTNRATEMKHCLLAGRCQIFNISGRRLITAAAVLHIALAAALFCAGRAQIAPQLLDRNALMPTSDSQDYRVRAVRLAEMLKNSGLRAWAAEPEQVHVKLISIQFAILSPLFGYSILSAEPYNLFCYVAILSLILMLGREVGGRQVGLLAAGIVALWPTFLLHTMQLLKDPLFIAAALTIILIVTTWLTRTYNWAVCIYMGAGIAVSTGLLLLIRLRFGVVIFAVVCFGLALLILRQLIERRLLYWNLICPLLILCVGALTPLYLGDGNRKLKKYPSDNSGLQKSDAGYGKQLTELITFPSAANGTKAAQSDLGGVFAATEMATLRLNAARYKFNATFPESSSAIDHDVEYKTFKELVLYLPRAFAIGCWAPFPDLWFKEGKIVGSAGRLLAGAETFIMYLCELLVLLGIWRSPRRLPAWLLLLISIFGLTALGLVVSNVGTLYRFRYLFWVLLIILGVNGITGFFRELRAAEELHARRSETGT